MQLPKRVYRLIATLTSLVFVYLLLTNVRQPQRQQLQLQWQNEGQIFIAANLFNAERLLRTSWADNIIQLIYLLDPEKVFVSIFENNSEDGTAAELQELQVGLPCRSRILTEDVRMTSLPRVRLQNGTTVVKRIAYLAALRNRVLEPLDTTFDRVLFLNDVVFHPRDVVKLLQTNNGSYSAACGLDYSAPLKFYDSWATRDIDGYKMGLPLYPYFGNGRSRDAMLSGSSAVPVHSCWSGIAVLDAVPFHTPPNPVRFRDTGSTIWDASECCLVYADLDTSRGVFINPDVRVAYDDFTFAWLPFVKRVEFLFPMWQRLANWLVDVPSDNPRRLDGKDGLCMDAFILLLNEDRSWTRVDTIE